MPVFPISDESGHLLPLARQEVVARMIFPADDTLRSHYLPWMVVAGVMKTPEKGAPQLPLSREIAAPLLAGPSFMDIQDRAVKETQHALRAAGILETILACHVHHPELNPSISKSRDLQSHVSEDGLEPYGLLLVALRFAEEIRSQAEEIFPHGKRQPVLDPRESWRVPTDLELPPEFGVRPAPLGDDAIEFLRTRKAPRRY